MKHCPSRLYGKMLYRNYRNEMKVMKDKLLVTNTWNICPWANMVIMFEKIGLGHLTAFVYQWIGDDMEETTNIPQ